MERGGSAATQLRATYPGFMRGMHIDLFVCVRVHLCVCLRLCALVCFHIFFSNGLNPCTGRARRHRWGHQRHGGRLGGGAGQALPPPEPNCASSLALCIYVCFTWQRVRCKDAMQLAKQDASHQTERAGVSRAILCLDLCRRYARAADLHAYCRQQRVAVAGSLHSPCRTERLSRK